mmetsp:Transcript_140/g.475  ORF Transcript_140/g.475 Transcript_140/m.475 type:complete len:237 (+) Transcript_140:498-1208(+)
MYCTTLLGKSKFTTIFTPLKSIPRDIRSVAISTQILPALKLLTVVSRCALVLSDVITPTLMFSNSNSRKRSIARAFDCTKMMTGGLKPSAIIWRMAMSLPSSLPQNTSFWSIVSVAEFSTPMTMRVGWRRKLRAISSTPGSIVALKSVRWTLGLLQAAMISSICLRKPYSKSWSASSSARYSTVCKLTSDSLSNCTSRSGVVTRMSWRRSLSAREVALVSTLMRKFLPAASSLMCW